MITPRKEEVAAVVEVLESGEFEDSASMAKELVKVIATELQKRDGYGVAIGLKSDDLRLAHGMYWTILEAKRVVKEAEARGLVAFVAPLLGASNALRDEEEATFKRCVCGHPAALHGSAIKPKAYTTLGCGVYRNKIKCPCKSYEAAK
ncbi:hypothetical protein UB45_07690 [Terrabacter sp. 28]|nr:hypothetical protein UB45_07690 [Terrabacter sp. 28]